MAWRLAKSADVLRDQINAAAPKRSISFDGTIGDEAHSARVSDHNPDGGVVHAIDFTHDPLDGVDIHKYARYLSEHPDRRIKYIISQGEIWNPSVSKKWRKRNKGKSDHAQHAHFSINKKYRDDTSKWDIGDIGKLDDAAPSVPSVVEHPTLRRGASGDKVKELQVLLGVVPDGVFGPLTEKAVKELQRDRKLTVDGIAGPYTWRELKQEPVPPSDKRIMKNIVATVFGGSSEVEKSAYPPFKRVGEDVMAVALPARFKGERPDVIVTNRANGKSKRASIVDIGPWNVNDPYWEQDGRRPQAESGIAVEGPNKGRKTNLAGIDLSPALAKAIGLSGMGHIDWEFA